MNQELIDALQGMDPTIPRDIYKGTGGLPTISVSLVETEAEETAPNKKGMSYMSMPPPWGKAASVRGGPWQVPKGLGADKGNLAHHARTMMPPSSFAGSMNGPPPKLRMPPRSAHPRAKVLPVSD